MVIHTSAYDASKQELASLGTLTPNEQRLFNRSSAPISASASPRALL